jgi:hypothetical protein
MEHNVPFNRFFQGSAFRRAVTLSERESAEEY